MFSLVTKNPQKAIEGRNYFVSRAQEYLANYFITISAIALKSHFNNT